jgi:hypothetical protein
MEEIRENMRRLHNEELHNLFMSNIVGMAVSRKMMCVGLVIWERGCTFSCLPLRERLK